MGKIGYQFLFLLFKEKGNLFGPIFRTCAVLLSLLDDLVGIVIRSV